jgi:cyclophilin family peptidyl-prolyl cis-trans isomerase
VLLHFVPVLAILAQGILLPPRTPVVSEPGITGSAQGVAVLAAEDARAPTPADISVLVQSTRSSTRQIQLAAIRALGRLERRDVVTDLLKFLRPPFGPEVRTEAAHAIAQGMRGERMPLDPTGTQIEGVLLAMLSAASKETEPGPLGAIARSLGRLPYERAEQVIRADALLVQVLTLSHELAYVRKQVGDALPAMNGAVAGAELLGRLHTKLAPASEELTTQLRRFATGRVPMTTMDRPPQEDALAALIQVRGLDEETLRISLESANDQVRRLAAAALGAGSSPLTGADRADSLRRLLGDRSQLVRYEAVRGYARSHARTDGCGPLVEALADKSMHVVLAALDGLGDACKQDEPVIDRVVGEARTPPNVGNWQRESHALLALARLSPPQAEIALAAHSRHAVWQVRMYAARAAGILNDAATLERLATDANDNVVEATLAPLRRIKGVAAEPQLTAALSRRDYQLLRSAAGEAKGIPPSKALTSALVDALKRVTAEKKETSRDARIAIIERLQATGAGDHVSDLQPLLRDFDPKVAAAISTTLNAPTGGAYPIDPQPLPRQPLPSADETSYLMEYNPVLVMGNGNEIVLTLDVTRAPMSSIRFLRLAKANYFDNLTFHRVVPNFVVQGGSPGANEYMGDGPYMRDEISALSHETGSIGISTRGRDTGDAQFFFNLVDNTRLDFEYTVFGNVAAASLDEMWNIVEGDTIKDVKFVRRR